MFVTRFIRAADEFVSTVGIAPPSLLTFLCGTAGLGQGLLGFKDLLGEVAFPMGRKIT